MDLVVNTRLLHLEARIGKLEKTVKRLSKIISNAGLDVSYDLDEAMREDLRAEYEAAE